MLKICDDCETVYAADLDKCPHCGTTGFEWNHLTAEQEAAKAAAALPKKAKAAEAE